MVLWATKYSLKNWKTLPPPPTYLMYTPLPYGFGLILCYIGLGLEQHLDYVTGLGLILLYIGLGLVKLLKQGCR